MIPDPNKQARIASRMIAVLLPQVLKETAFREVAFIVYAKGSGAAL